MNVGDDYAGKGRKRVGAWRDTVISLRGPAVSDLARIFAEDWCFMALENPPLPPLQHPQGPSTVAILPSGPDQDENAAAFAWFSCVGLAVKRAWLATPYFVPDPPMLRALTSAARRGVDVRVLLPERADTWLMSVVNRSYVPQLLEAGIRVFYYQPAMLHAKTLVVDEDLSMIGSANVDMRSFDLNFEAGALVADAALATRMAGAFEEDLLQSREVTGAQVRRAGVVARLTQGALQVLSPVL
jgi:cardiolipin synthase